MKTTINDSGSISIKLGNGIELNIIENENDGIKILNMTPSRSKIVIYPSADNSVIIKGE